MKAVWIARCVVAALSLLAGIANAQSIRDADFLRHYPTPQRVKADIASNAGNARPEEIDGRVAGRLLMMAETLEATFGGKFGKTSFDNAAPAEAKRLHAVFMRQFQVAYRQGMPPLQAECAVTLARQKSMRTCARANFMAAMDDYRFGADATSEAARLYFPASYRERFAGLSPGAEVRNNAAKNRAEQESAEQLATTEASRKRKDRLVGVIGGGVFLLLSLGVAIGGFLMFLKAGKMGHGVGKYEFENRTDGGVVRFETYEDVKRHELKRQGSGCLGITGLLLLAAGGMMSCVALIVVFRALFA